MATKLRARHDSGFRERHSYTIVDVITHRSDWRLFGQRVLAIALVLCIASGLSVQASAETVSVTIAPNYVTIRMNLALQENITSLNSFSAQIGPENSTAVQQAIAEPINSSLQGSGARLSSLSLNVHSSNSTGMWNLVENYTITVTGTNTNSGSNIQSNLDFIRLNLTQPFQYGGTELNSVGPAVILPALEAKVTQFSNLVYYIDGSNPSTSLIPERTTQGFSMLDFTWIPQVSTWTENRNLLGQSTNWTYDPTGPRYNLTIGVPSPEGLLIKSYVAIYSPSFSVSVPANAWINGNTVSFDVSTPAESVMPIIALTALIAAIGAIILDWRLSRSQRTKRKR